MRPMMGAAHGDFGDSEPPRPDSARPGHPSSHTDTMRASTARAPAPSRAPTRPHTRRARRASSRGVRARASPDAELASRVVDALKGCSVTIVGDDERLNDAVARALAVRLGYSPVSVPALVRSTAAMERDDDGDDGDDGEEVDEATAALVLENSAHEQLSTFLRLVVATCGGGRGATARGDCWTWLFGSVTVWVDGEETDADAPQRDAYELSEVRVTARGGDETDAEATAARVLVGIDALLTADEQLCGKKNLYVRFGCRGDWPDLQPPGDEGGGWRGELAELAERRRRDEGGEGA